MPSYDSTTNKQRFYRVNGILKVEIDVDVTRESPDAPSIKDCRHAVLSLDDGYVVYDRLLSRIVNGVFSGINDALMVAADYNRNPDAPQDMAPNGCALGLIYPPSSEEDES